MNTTGRRTRTGKPYLGRKASKDHPVYKIGFVVGVTSLKGSYPGTKNKPKNEEEKDHGPRTRTNQRDE